MQKNSIGQDGERPCTVTSGQRSSAEAVARDREKSRKRAAAMRAARTAEEHEVHLKERREYEYKNRDHINEARRYNYGEQVDRFANRPFIFWDGEGGREFIGHVDSPPEEKHCYILFGCSRDPDHPLVGRDLGTVDCLDYLLDIERRCPDAFHVGFAFSYDVNMILKDLEQRKLRTLANSGVVHWKGYRIQYIPGKRFRVSKGNPKRGEERISATIDDMFGFFHSKFTTACLKFGVATKAEIRATEEGKKKRGTFTYLDIEYVKKYWQEEISFGPPLADAMRTMAYDAGLIISSWHGPGALAAFMLRRHGVAKWHSQEAPNEVSIATRYAYAGGRFQYWRCGLYRHPIYTADINSAYIYACSLLPRLDTGRWRRIHRNRIDRDRLPLFGLYHIKYDAGREAEKRNRTMGAFGEIYPLFHRDRSGNLFWPYATEGWYWGPEARTVADNPDAEFLEAWVFDDDGTMPFAWVGDEFDKRLILQRLGNPAEKTIKWALAAIYGAFGRRVGWNRKLRCAPSSHELAWAGFITSWCRAEMYRLGYECWKRGGLVSIDTDGITSTVPFEEAWLPRGVGERLGQWKLETFKGIMYWGSGFYWLLDDEEQWSTAKSRGVKKGSIEVSEALEAYERADYQSKPNRPATIELMLTRFVGFKEALNRHDGLKSWRKWVRRPYKSVMGRSETCLHIPAFCRKCRSPEADMMHIISHAGPKAMQSEPHRLPWLEEQPEMPRYELIINMQDESDAWEPI